MSNPLEYGVIVKTNLTIRDHHGDIVAKISDEMIKNKIKRLTIKRQLKSGSVSLHYRGLPITVSGTCAGSLTVDGNIQFVDIAVKGRLTVNF